MTAIWREHDFTFSASPDGATITATCSAGDHCSLTDGRISLAILKPDLTTYGETSKGFSANATLTLDGVDAFEAYAGDVEAFKEYAKELEEFIENEEEMEAWEKYWDEWIGKYMHYYKTLRQTRLWYRKQGRR